MATAAAIVGGLLAAGGTIYGAERQADAAEAQADRRRRGLNRAARFLDAEQQAVIDQVLSGDFLDQFGAEDVFGARPDVAEFDPVSLQEAQAESVAANQLNLEGIQGLVDQVARGVTQGDLTRARGLDPNIDQSLSALSEAANELLQGRLPQDVVDQVNRSAAQRFAGAPGGQAPLVARDLGLSSLQAQQLGVDFLGQEAGILERLSPVSRTPTATSFLVSPQEATNLGLTQAQLAQQSAQNRFNVAAQPDPAASSLFQGALARISNTAGLQAGASQIQAPVPNFANLYGQIGSQLGGAVTSAFAPSPTSGASIASTTQQQQPEGFNISFGNLL